MGGGTPNITRPARTRAGLSPRGRGNPLGYYPSNTVYRSIPAWAGEPVKCLAFNEKPGVYPRVGGGTALRVTAQNGKGGLSPRGRGNQGKVTRPGKR